MAGSSAVDHDVSGVAAGYTGSHSEILNVRGLSYTIQICGTSYTSMLEPLYHPPYLCVHKILLPKQRLFISWRRNKQSCLVQTVSTMYRGKISLRLMFSQCVPSSKAQTVKIAFNNDAVFHGRFSLKSWAFSTIYQSHNCCMSP